MEETINIALSIYKDYQKQNLANKFVNFLIGWDSQTEAPNDCFEARGRQIEVLSTATYKLNTSPELVKAVQTLYENRTSLNEITAHEIVVVKKNIDKIIKVPMEEFVELSTLLASSQNIWAKAKVENNFELFKPTLKRIIELLKLYLSHLETPKLKGYNILLDEYEPGFTTKEYDEFFDTLKKELVPFVKKVATKALQYNHSFTNFKYPKDDQKKFAKKIMDTLCFNHNKGLMKESEHPFTTGFGTSDVRFTVHYHEDNLASAIFSAIHELGHATYEMQVDPALDVTLSGGGASLAMHESQSRF
ncbi:MAG: carboxypeptidase M32, partial [Bacilli bacterium]